MNKNNFWDKLRNIVLVLTIFTLSTSLIVNLSGLTLNQILFGEPSNNSSLDKPSSNVPDQPSTDEPDEPTTDKPTEDEPNGTGSDDGTSSGNNGSGTDNGNTGTDDNTNTDQNGYTGLFYKGSVSTDLTNTTWYVAPNWQATSGYGIFNITGSVDVGDYTYSLEGGYSGFAIGYQADEANWPSEILKDNNITFDMFNYINSNRGFTVKITGGADATNSELISWLQANGELQITDLTNTAWYIPDGWSASAGYGQFSINGEVESDGGLVVTAFDSMNIGYDASGTQDRHICYNDDDETWNSHDVKIYFTGGTDVTNSTLIAWLKENATFVRVDTTP